jgi:hypothetical protein
MANSTNISPRKRMAMGLGHGLKLKHTESPSERDIKGSKVTKSTNKDTYNGAGEYAFRGKASPGGESSTWKGGGKGKVGTVKVDAKPYNGEHQGR